MRGVFRLLIGCNKFGHFVSPSFCLNQQPAGWQRTLATRAHHCQTHGASLALTRRTLRRPVSGWQEMSSSATASLALAGVLTTLPWSLSPVVWVAAADIQQRIETSGAV